MKTITFLQWRIKFIALLLFSMSITLYGQETKTKPEDVVSSPKKTQSKADDDSEEIVGGGLPDPHPV